MIEVEFIPIGEEVNTGDAILCHFTEPITGFDRVVLIDGGFVDTSERIMSHIRRYYGRSSIDLVVSTHPDDDHINGLTGVIESMSVTNLLIHRPKEHGYGSDEVKSSKVEDLIAIALRRGVNVITDAYAGETYYNGAIMIAGPTRDFYLEQLAAQTGASAIVASLSSAIERAIRAITAALRPRDSDPGEGVLEDHGGTSARNNSSIVLDVQVDGYRVLLTGDAGVPALNVAATTIETMARNIRVPDFFDIPHHGSRHNLDSATANRLLGPVIGATAEHTAFASVGKKADDFPRPEVANALTRRGYQVCATRGQTIRWHRNAEARPDWVALTPLGWMEV